MNHLRHYFKQEIRKKKWLKLLKCEYFLAVFGFYDSKLNKLLGFVTQSNEERLWIF